MPIIHPETRLAATAKSIIEKMRAANKAECRPINPETLRRGLRELLRAETGESGTRLEARVDAVWKAATRPHQQVEAVAQPSPHEGLAKAVQEQRRAARKQAKAGMRHRRTGS